MSPFFQDMLYQSLKFTNNIWVIAELKMQPGVPTAQVCYATPSWRGMSHVHPQLYACISL